MTSAQSPLRPFPHQGTFSLETGPVENQSGALLLPPTLMLPALSEVRSFATVYLERFAARTHPGQAVMLRGPHGTGKTHALGYTLSRVSAGSIGPPRNDWDVLQLYGKAEEPDLVGLYRSLMPQIPPATLRRLVLRFNAEIAADSLDETLEPELAQEVRVRLRERPESLAGMLQEYFVDASEILKRSYDEIGLLTGGSVEFANAFRWIDSELGDIAYQWFVGRDLATGELHKIGATSPISSAKAARNGLQLLSALCQRAGTALIVYCDQFEKLVLDADNRLDRDAAGIFHSLVEVLPKHDALFVIAGNDRAWNRLPQDLQQRFGYKVAQARGLELHEAEALVRLYLRPRDELRSVPTRDDPPIDEEELHPFTRDGLRLLHLYSGGNPRILLQLCGAAWDEADGNLIDEEAARAAAHTAGAEPVDPESALAAVRALGEARGFTVKQMRGGNSAGLRLAYKGQDRLAILLGQSTHYYDEVLDASKHVDSFVKLQKSAPEAKPMVLALGYDSPEVRDKLEKAGIDVLSYDPRTFSDDFGRVLASLTRDEGTVAADEALTQELAELRQQLEALRVEREADVRGLAAQASAVEASQTEEQLGVRWQRALNDWAGERRRLEERISDARKARRVDDLEQLARLRAHAERDRDRRARIIWGAVAIVVALTLTGVALTSDASSQGGIVVAALGAAGLTGLVLWLYWHLLRFGSWGVRDQLFRSGVLRDLSTPVSSVEDLRRLAYRARAAHPPLRFLLRHPNPQVRYVAAVTAEPEQLHRLALAIPGERSALVRRAFAQRVAIDPDVAVETVDDLLSADTREALYVLERLTYGGHPVDQPPFGAGRDLWEVLTAMYEHPQLAPAARALAAITHDADFASDVSQALMSGLPLGSRPTLRQIPFETLRECARVVSPLEDYGLGSLDELRIIDDIDRAFLGVSQILFLSELGLLVDPE